MTKQSNERASDKRPVSDGGASLECCLDPVKEYYVIQANRAAEKVVRGLENALVTLNNLMLNNPACARSEGRPACHIVESDVARSSTEKDDDAFFTMLAASLCLSDDVTGMLRAECDEYNPPLHPGFVFRRDVDVRKAYYATLARHRDVVITHVRNAMTRGGDCDEGRIIHVARMCIAACRR